MAKPKRRSTETPNPSFSPSEIEKMEKLALENKGEVLNKSLYKNLTEELNVSSGRTESEALQTKQVQEWFESRRKCQPTEGVSSLTTLKDQVPSDISLSNNEPEILYLPKDTEEKAPRVADLEFEAKSSRDEAWYDVEMFLNHRFDSSGELEVRVRFKGYGAEEDEWLNVKEAVRGCSIPLEKGDCAKVSVGDTVLCFREGKVQAVYHDAVVTDVDRRQHDMRGCRCLFAVRYCHDETEELLTARKVCRRPPLP